MNECDDLNVALKRKSTRSILRVAENNEQDDFAIKPARNNNYLGDHSSRSKHKLSK